MRRFPCRNPDCSNCVGADERRFYCSNACKQKHYRERKPKATVVKPKYVRNCLKCGQKFLTRSVNHWYCSTSCRVALFNKQKRELIKVGME